MEDKKKAGYKVKGSELTSFERMPPPPARPSSASASAASATESTSANASASAATATGTTSGSATVVPPSPNPPAGTSNPYKKASAGKPREAIGKEPDVPWGNNQWIKKCAAGKNCSHFGKEIAEYPDISRGDQCVNCGYYLHKECGHLAYKSASDKTLLEDFTRLCFNCFDKDGKEGSARRDYGLNCMYSLVDKTS